MKVRLLTPEDASAHEAVASQAFCLSSDPSSATLPEEMMPGAFDDEGHLMADMEIIQRRVNFCGNELKCAAIGGVASKPEYRNRGAVRALFEEMYGPLFEEHGWEVSILYPFSNLYYRKFGYENAGKTLRIKAPFSELREYGFSTAELYDESKLDEILELYARCTAGDCLSFIRTDGHYFSGDPYADVKYTYMWKDGNGKARSYATVIPDRDVRTVYVHEINYEDLESLKGILAFLNSFSGNFDYVVFDKVPEYSPIPKMILNDRIKNIKTECGDVGAVRVMDVTGVLKKVSYPEEKCSFTIEVRDTIERNTGFYHVESEGGKCSVTKTAEGDADIVLGSSALVLLLTGVLSAEDAAYERGVTVINPSSDFFRVFRPRKIFFNDGF